MNNINIDREAYSVALSKVREIIDNKLDDTRKFMMILGIVEYYADALKKYEMEHLWDSLLKDEES